MSWRVTLHCTRAEAEAVPDSDHLFQFSDSPPVLVADEPDPQAPDDWRIHAYFTDQPTTQELVLLGRMAAGAQPGIEHLAEDDWVKMSQAGLEPIRAGRFFVHTPSHLPDDRAINFEIDAGLAFGTGQHDTTAGCLAALDRLESPAHAGNNIAHGTGTGMLALPNSAVAEERASPPTSIDQHRRHRRQRGIKQIALDTVRVSYLPGRDGMEHEMLVARAPFDLLIEHTGRS